MVVVAETGCLPALRGQELPLALWVGAPIHPPTPGDEALATALLPTGTSRQRGGAAQLPAGSAGGALDQDTVSVPWVHGELPQLQGSSGQWCRPNESKFRVVPVAAGSWMGTFLPDFRQVAAGRQRARGEVCGASSRQPGFY